MKKFLSLLLALVMVFSLVACGGGETTESKAPNTDNVDNTDPGNGEDGYTGPDWAAIDAMDEEDASDAIYEWNFGDFLEYYQAAKAESDVDMRLALMALAEAKLMETGTMLPVTGNGAGFAMGRVVPRTNPAVVLWGMDEYRYHTTLVTNELIKATDRKELQSLWSEAETADEYLTAARAYLDEHGYTLSDTYIYANSYILNIWDTIATSYTSDASFIAGTYDNLMEYDCKGALQPGLAEKYEVSADGTVYTFHIREGVQWVDQQGSPIGEVTADDWVASMEHLADNNEALGWLLSVSDGCGIKNWDAFLQGECAFEDVGVKAVDKYTLEYTLEAKFPAFITMFGYSIFAPLNRDFYRSQGGTFGVEGEEYTPGDYGKTPSNIAYCGPYLITNYTAQNTIRYEANPSYWNADAVNVHTVIFSYDDSSDVMRAYNETKDGTRSATGLTTNVLIQAKEEIPEGETESYFDLYSYQTTLDASTFPAWINLNRGSWTNYDDTSVGVSTKKDNDVEIARTRDALNNQHFRLALQFGLDRGAYRAVSAGEEMKLAGLRNSYTPGTFLYLAKDVTVDINGTPTTFTAGTSYGAIEQAQIDADGLPIQVWDPNGDSGAGSGDGFDGWHNPTAAAEQLELAIAELAQIGVEISDSNPLHLDYVYGTFNEIFVGRAQAVKQSIEQALGGKVIIDLVGIDTDTALEIAYYRINHGSEANYDYVIGSGWGPDYGDAQSYLDTVQPGGYMTKLFGLY